MLQNAEQVPAPRRHLAKNEIRPHPHDEQWPVETWRAAGKLRPYVVCKVFPKVARRLHARITREAVVVQDEVVLQRRCVYRVDHCEQKPDWEKRTERPAGL